MLGFLAVLFGPCETGFTPIDFQDHRVCVMRDYYMEDGIRVPMTYWEALEIAYKNGWTLPTPDLVDAIWENADLKLMPIYTEPNEDMASRSRVIVHNDLINRQIGDRSFTLVAGHKKDVVMQEMEGRVTIYGWHNLDGIPVQPVSSVHHMDYYDYSHGFRFVYYLN